MRKESARQAGELKEQIAVVTGATRGVGRAIAGKLAAMGATVVLTARDPAALESAKQSLEAQGGQAVAQSCDLRDESSVAALAERVRQLGRCDILVNCAGVGHTGQPLHEMTVEDFDDVMNTNLRAPFLMIRALVPLMIESGGGHIINISSLAGRNPLPSGAAYSASKWALNGLTYSVAEELRQHRIRVAVVAPGSVNTGFEGSDPDSQKASRKIQPDDIAQVVAMLVTQAPQSFVSEVLVRPTIKP